MNVHIEKETKMGIDPSTFRAAMREFPAGVTIISAGKGTDRRGLTATAVCSLSAEPPALLVCVNRNSQCHDTILQYSAFGVNVLAGGGETLAARFAGHGGAKGAERFAEGSWIELLTGAPILADAAVAFDCTLREVLDGGSHSIFIGDVAAAHLNGQREALVYRAGQFSRIAHC